MKPVDGRPRDRPAAHEEWTSSKGFRRRTIERAGSTCRKCSKEVSRRSSRGWDGARARGRGAMLEFVQKVRGVSLFPGDPAKFDLTTVKGVAEWKGHSLGSREPSRFARSGGEGAARPRIRRAPGHADPAGPGRCRRNSASSPDDHQRRHARCAASGDGRGVRGRKTKFDLMVLSPKAAGVGLTILSANHVIHLSRWWNPAIEDQCNDRVYRIGAKLPVTIHIPIAVHPRFGDQVLRRQLDNLIEHKRRDFQRLADAARVRMESTPSDGGVAMRVFARRLPAFTYSDVEGARVAFAFQNEDGRARLMK